MLFEGRVSPEAERLGPGPKHSNSRLVSYLSVPHLHAELGWRRPPEVSVSNHKLAYDRNLDLIRGQLSDYELKISALEKFVKSKNEGQRESARKSFYGH